MKKLDVIFNNTMHYLTEEQILDMMVEFGIDPNEEVSEGDTVKFGYLSFTAYGMGGAARKLLKTAEVQPTQVVCPTCNGKGKVDA